ncbi:sensor domain-containing diguanylate cyclase [Sulfurimonas marina]|uniref:Diguanylate cyclase n=1 Tax=Sulfurimonas marina TaxID=2590551 RepID=A0A7M1AUV0_9BACT|nr:sensor domain-containing diguanylate cyclase [Sulfurimonas marina]QOP41156.1 diguanylate cyclase [Sulfurimonas marina]
MLDRLKLNSLHVHLSLIIIVTVSLFFGFYSLYLYVQTKKEVDSQMKSELTRDIESVSGSITRFMDAYSPNEYQKIIIDLVNKQNIAAIIIDDYNMQRILSDKSYRVGYIKENNLTAEIDFNDPKQLALLNHPYYKETIELKNIKGKKLGEVTFFISNEVIKKEIEKIIEQNIFLAVLTSLFLTLILFISIKYFIVNHLTRIVDVISNYDQDGIPVGEVESEGSFEIRYIIDRINTMIRLIKKSREELHTNYELLQTEKDRFQLTIKATNDGIWDWNMKTDEVFFSKRWKSMLGYTDDEITNDVNEWEKRVHPDDLEKALEDLDAHLNGETPVYENEHRVQHKDGHWLWILDRGKALFDENGKPYRMLGFHTDMTQRHKFIESLKVEQERYKSLLELSSDGIHLIDHDGKLYDYSESFLKMLGYTKEEAKNLNVSDWDVKIPEEEIKTFIHKLMNEPQSFETIHKRKDGSTFIVSINAKGIEINGEKYIYASARDVTKEKQHQLEIRRKLQRFVDTQSSIVILTDGKNLKFANNTFLDFFDCKNIEEFLKTNKCICERFIKEDKFFHLEKVQKGEEHWIESLLHLSGRQRVVAMKNSEGQIHAFNVAINKYEGDEYIVNFTDISDTMSEKFELAQQASVDTLTSAYNRMYFNQNIENILNHHIHNNMSTGIIMFDIDKFKDVNDTYGHDVGDYVLKTLVQIVQRYTRTNDKVIRWGGEEFIIICPIKGEETLEKIAEYLRSTIENYKFDYVEKVTCSFGCAIHDLERDILKTIKEADQKLYQAKELGRNRVVC